MNFNIYIFNFVELVHKSILKMSSNLLKRIVMWIRDVGPDQTVSSQYGIWGNVQRSRMSKVNKCAFQIIL